VSGPLEKPLSGPPEKDVSDESPAIGAIVATAVNYFPLAHSFAGRATVPNPSDSSGRDLPPTGARGDGAAPTTQPRHTVPVGSRLTAPAAGEQFWDGLSLALLAIAATLAGIAFFVMLKLSALGSDKNPERVRRTPNNRLACGHRFAPL
jgi:hypothetical protein